MLSHASRIVGPRTLGPRIFFQARLSAIERIAGDFSGDLDAKYPIVSLLAESLVRISGRGKKKKKNHPFDGKKNVRKCEKLK